MISVSSITSYSKISCKILAWFFCDLSCFSWLPLLAMLQARQACGAEVTGVEGRTIAFRVEARDERELVGDGTHERVVVNVARFDERVQRKLQ